MDPAVELALENLFDLEHAPVLKSLQDANTFKRVSNCSRFLCSWSKLLKKINGDGCGSARFLMEDPVFNSDLKFHQQNPKLQPSTFYPPAPPHPIQSHHNIICLNYGYVILVVQPQIKEGNNKFPYANTHGAVFDVNLVTAVDSAASACYSRCLLIQCVQELTEVIPEVKNGIIRKRKAELLAAKIKSEKYGKAITERLRFWIAGGIPAATDGSLVPEA